MLLFRSITTGMLGACLYCVLHLPPPTETAPAATRIDRAQRMSVSGGPQEPATVIDMAGVPPRDVPAYIQVLAGERIESVNDRRVSNDLVAGVVIVERARAGGYIDVSIRGPDATSSRRVLVLMH